MTDFRGSRADPFFASGTGMAPWAFIFEVVIKKDKQQHDAVDHRSHVDFVVGLPMFFVAAKANVRHRFPQTNDSNGGD